MSYLAANPNATLNEAFNQLATTRGGAVAGYTSAANFLTSFNTNGANFIANSMNLDNDDTGAIGGLDADGGAAKTAASVVSDVGTRGGNDVLTGFAETYENIGSVGGEKTQLTFQIGAKVGDTLEAGIGAINAAALGILGSDLTTEAGRAITQMDRALEYVNQERAKIGAQLNRLESTITNLQTSTANLSAARSRIRDADFAAETGRLTRAQIPQQAGIAMMAQANAQPNIVLSLLR
jgi:flagellin